ncbi:GNAT family N-acetyltransferase [Geminicoccus flavidas]|uniref:GNAT family N-acetyltransferase n=1 Tax=Geminicoccus flavidas TaxID=2506407 RepID=UPI001358A6F4|nr:GNAT family N-acetyltransferase [Geminicoccus flavidas]
MTIRYAQEPELDARAFRDLLAATTLGARRPIEDLPRLERMLRQADIVLTARAGTQLVGVARAITDFAYACYLSDLAVHESFQRRRIGRRLIAETHAVAGKCTTLVLVAAPGAETFYAGIGMAPLPSSWAIWRSS